MSGLLLLLLLYYCYYYQTSPLSQNASSTLYHLQTSCTASCTVSCTACSPDFMYCILYCTACSPDVQTSAPAQDQAGGLQALGGKNGKTLNPQTLNIGVFPGLGLGFLGCPTKPRNPTYGALQAITLGGCPTKPRNPKYGALQAITLGGCPGTCPPLHID